MFDRRGMAWIAAVVCALFLGAGAERGGSFSLILAAPQAPNQTPKAKPPEAKVDFQRQVRPILSDNCFQCHGPDQSTRMVGLRLDQKEDALASARTGVPWFRAT